jgi:hypothetical protein|eukprot:CAMPEP_0174297916 /NCGR_PEP_ID=MMETSP0809-20121228/52360_1 /TAXON_ID=73025 ORGANISM="Eutreptiella gymnastica-like, Strain CCMP1594" /NCGR_SAMPLE_ID=MMETSP0809 /ASSEMBLY_ACC=CAM_ASM_000658 /LENGTH=243 /DNA_ID=CAMNT_0015402031 /DNA_START=40 /DNA_END=771 /DNA_ORIENTATION=-
MANNYCTVQNAATSSGQSLWQLAGVSLGAAGVAAGAVFMLLSSLPTSQLLANPAVVGTRVQTVHVPRVQPQYSAPVRHAVRPISAAQAPETGDFAVSQVEFDVSTQQPMQRKTLSLGWLLALAVPFNAALVTLVYSVVKSLKPQTKPSLAHAGTGQFSRPSQLFSSSRMGTQLYASQFQDVPEPRASPKFTESPIGFVKNAEIFNSRAAMVGFFALLLVEALLGQPLLTFIGIEVGQGIDIGF